MATPTIREVVSNQTTSSASLTISTSSAVQVGDTLFVIQGADYSTPPTPATPTGTSGTWTSRGTFNGSAHPTLRFWSRPVTVAGVQNTTLTGISGDWVVGTVIVLIGVTAFGASNGTNTSGSVTTGSPPTAPSVSTSANADDLLISAFQFLTFSGTPTQAKPSVQTSRAHLTTGSNSGFDVGTQVLTASGSTGTRAAAWTGTASDGYAAAQLCVAGAVTAKFGAATATLILSATRTTTSAHSGAPTATVRLDTSETTSAAKNVSPAAATLILASTAGGSPAKNVAVAAAPMILAASATGAKINLGLAVLTLSASMASPLHHGIASRTAPAVLQATVAGTHRATTIGPIEAVLRLATSADTVSDHFGGPTDPAVLFLSAAANAERIITEVTQAIQSRASLSVQYELVCMARIPQTTGPPLLLAVDPIDWTGLSYTDELSKPQQLQAGCQISGLTDAVVQRLRNLDELATELWLYRLGKLVFAGPLLGWQVQGEALTFNASGLLAYLKSMVIQKDLVFSQVDQFAMASAMVDQWQSLDYGNFGIDTTSVGASGVLRDGTYLTKELHNVGQRVGELGLRQNGFDVSVDPSSRRFTLDYPIKGVDRSSGEDAIVFDDRNVTSPNIVASSAPGDVASEGYGTGTNSGAGGDTIFSVASNLELRARYGRTAVTATFDGVSEQTTLDAYTQGLIDARGNVLLVPGPNVRVTPDSDLGSYDVGDTVSYQLHSRLSVAGAFRIRKRQVTVSKTGQESTSIQFV